MKKINFLIRYKKKAYFSLGRVSSEAVFLCKWMCEVLIILIILNWPVYIFDRREVPKQ